MVQPYPQYPQPQWTPSSYKLPQAATAGAAAPPKEIPLPVLIAAIIVLWILLAGGAIGYVAVAPCSVLKTLVGEASLAKLQDQGNLETPCTFGTDSFSCQGVCKESLAPNCKVWKLDVNEGCRQFIIEATTK